MTFPSVCLSVTYLSY